MWTENNKESGVPKWIPKFRIFRRREELLSYEKYRYYMLYKPAGVVSAATDRRDQTVLDLIPELKGRTIFRWEDLTKIP